MEKLALFRKYRPTDFDNLVGQEFVKTTLVNAFKSENVSHAYLFSGPRGTGKTSTARLIAKMLNCEKPNSDFTPCGECEFCRNINDGNLIDLVEIDAASNRGIDEVRALKEVINFRPTRSKYKIYIIDEVHMMTKEAFNALLKTLEEPPDYAYFILATTEIHKIPETIISRCQRFDFKRINEADIVARLKFIADSEDIAVENGVLKIIAQNVSGGMRDAIGFLEQFTIDGEITKANVTDALGIADNSIVIAIINALKNGNGKSALEQLENAYTQGYDLRNLSDNIIAQLRLDMLKAIKSGDNEKSGLYIGMIKTILDSRIFTESDIPQLALEVAFVKIGGCNEYVFDEPIPVSGLTPVNSTVPQLTVKSTTQVRENVSLKTNIDVEKEASKSIESVKPASLTTEKRKEPAQKKQPVVKKKPVEKPIGNSDITREWKNIVKSVKSPAIRMSLNTARIADINGESVTLTFNSKFHMEKSIGKESKTIVENIAYKLTGINYRFKGEIELSKVLPAYRQKSESTSSSKSSTNTDSDEPTAEDIAIGIFS